MFDQKYLSKEENWIGHLIRGNGLLKDVLEGRMWGRESGVDQERV